MRCILTSIRFQCANSSLSTSVLSWWDFQSLTYYVHLVYMLRFLFLIRCGKVLFSFAIWCVLWTYSRDWSIKLNNLKKEIWKEERDWKLMTENESHTKSCWHLNCHMHCRNWKQKWMNAWFAYWNSGIDWIGIGIEIRLVDWWTAKLSSIGQSIYTRVTSKYF